MTDDPSAQRALDDVFATEWPRLVGYVARIVRDLGAAEEIVQDAMVAALRRWPFDGVPDRPAAWLTTTCRNRALNHLRDSARRRDHEAPGIEQLSVSDVIGEHRGPLEDDRLRLMFLCCHPDLPRSSQVALTLRMVAGLSTPDIARAFLVAESAMAQRISRAKRAVVEQGLSFEAPPADQLEDRLAAVIDVVYLIFNEGYLPRSGDALERGELAAEAHRLAALLTELVPDQPRPWALLALIALQRSRAASRTGPDGELVTLEAQDRSRWDAGLIAAGLRALERAAAFGRNDPMVLQAQIAACHAAAQTWVDTDWHRVLALYDELRALTPSTVVAMNRAVAVCMTLGPARALAALDEVAAADELRSHHLYWASRADYLARLGEAAAAITAFERAATLTTNSVELRHLNRRIDECRAAHGGSINRGDSHRTR